MAEVLSPHMQSSSTITMLHSRPSSSDAFHASQQHYSQPARLGQAPRSMYNGPNTSYRGSSTPVQTYAFQSTPNLRQENRTTSAPAVAQVPVANHKQAASVSTTSSETSSSHPSAKEDSLLSSRPTSVINLSSTLPDLSFTSFEQPTLTSFEQPAKASPDRYRRPAQKKLDSSHDTPKVPSPQLGNSGFAAADRTQRDAAQKRTSVDDMALPRTNQSELAKRYRRRSLNTLETQNIVNGQPVPAAGAAVPRPSSGHGATSTPTTIRPISLAGDEQFAQATAAKTESKAKDGSSDSSKTAPPRVDQKLSVPPRGSSEPTKRLAAPSPLSREASDASTPAAPTAPSTKGRTYAAVAQAAVATPSPAAQQLAAVSDKDLNKGMKSRLRRAFSFGSAQELRRTAGQNNQAAAQVQQAKEQQRQQIDDDLDAEQLEIARRQEAAGIGAGIYSGQGGFSGSTDNLSISSTASSASMMLRKMGKGAKKGARSIKGLFRPKSVIGVPAADGPIAVGTSCPVEATVAQVSMVTVEAERLKVNVNAHPEEKSDGGTGFPKLERNSMDAAAHANSLPDVRGSADGSDSHSRRSIVGSDKDRADVLAAVKKGILKRSGTNSPNGSPVIKPNDAMLGAVPQITESPTSSMPSTPRDGPPGRSASSPTVNSDYFGARVTIAKSMPNTPNGSVRSISFSPRIQFHDAWSSTDYDRRGDIATCNRLTPMLAQQIKEELNTFKMEMEVHEMSKPHTHFF